MTMYDVLDKAKARDVFFLFGETPKLFFKRYCQSFKQEKRQN